MPALRRPRLHVFFWLPILKATQKICEDVPDVGETIFTMDFGQDEMREMKVDFRIMRDIGEDAERDSLDEVTVAYLPPKTYPTGSVSLRHIFVHAGNYAGLVTVDGPHGEHWVARFPFAVSRPYSVRLPYYLLTAAAVLVMLLYSGVAKSVEGAERRPLQ